MNDTYMAFISSEAQEAFKAKGFPLSDFVKVIDEVGYTHPIRKEEPIDETNMMYRGIDLNIMRHHIHRMIAVMTRQESIELDKMTEGLYPPGN